MYRSLDLQCVNHSAPTLSATCRRRWRHQVLEVQKGAFFILCPPFLFTRLKISLATLGSPLANQCPWSLVEETEAYVQKLPHINASCRLSSTEELRVLDLCIEESADATKSVLIRNRHNMLSCMTQKAKSMVVVYPRKPMVWYCFDSLIDRTCVEATPDFWSKHFTQYFQQSAYARPSPEEIEGQPAIDFLEKCVAGGLKIKGMQLICH